MNLQTVSLQSQHDRSEFDCGVELLDNYLKKQASQDIKKRLSTCFVYCEQDDQKEHVKGYYTLSNHGINRNLVPERYAKKFPPSYRTIPATLLGRLARDKKATRPRLGETLLLDALYRAYNASKQLGSFAVIVDPIDKNAERFYEKYGFRKLPDSGKMFMPMAEIKRAFEQKE